VAGRVRDLVVDDPLGPGGIDLHHGVFGGELDRMSGIRVLGDDATESCVGDRARHRRLPLDHPLRHRGYNGHK